MAALGELFGKMPIFGGGSFVEIAQSFIIFVVAVGIITAIIFWVRNKKQWNLNVEFKLPRSDGRFMAAEWGKGCYNAKRGAVFVKRKGMRKAGMKPFDIKRYIQGNNILTVTQVGPEDYRPILPDSFIEMKDDETGEEASLMELKIDTTSNKAWKNAFERDAKQAFSIASFLREYGGIISIGLVIFLWGIQFLVIYNKVA